MLALWAEIVDDGTAEQVFERINSADTFLEFMRSPQNFPVVGYEGPDPACVAWLNGVAEGHAFVHHVFLRRVWGRTIPIASAILDYWFGLENPDMNEPMFETLIGSTPAHLRLARSFARRLGFTFLSPAIPGIGPNGVLISYLERATWERAAAER